MADCGGSTEFVLERQTVDGYRTREDAQGAAQDHIRKLAAEQSQSICKGTCDPETSRCKAVVLDQDLAEPACTFMHFDDDGDPSFGWLVEGTITVHCVCVGKHRPNKPIPPVPMPVPVPVPVPGSTEAAPKRRARKATGRQQPTGPQ